MLEEALRCQVGVFSKNILGVVRGTFGSKITQGDWTQLCSIIPKQQGSVEIKEQALLIGLH